jgi:hypothetical protein
MRGSGLRLSVLILLFCASALAQSWQVSYAGSSCDANNYALSGMVVCSVYFECTDGTYMTYQNDWAQGPAAVASWQCTAFSVGGAVSAGAYVGGPGASFYAGVTRWDFQIFQAYGTDDCNGAYTSGAYVYLTDY